MSQLIVFLALAFSIVIAIFAVQNTMAVPLQFLNFHAEAVAVSVLVLISAALGAAAMLLLGIGREASLRWQHRAVTQQLKQAQARVAELEAAAVSSQPPAVSGALAPTTPTAPNAEASSTS